MTAAQTQTSTRGLLTAEESKAGARDAVSQAPLPDRETCAALDELLGFEVQGAAGGSA